MNCPTTNKQMKGFALGFCLGVSADFFKETLIVSGKRAGQERWNEHRCEGVNAHMNT